jgi:hypothetical protein
MRTDRSISGDQNKALPRRGRVNSAWKQERQFSPSEKLVQQGQLKRQRNDRKRGTVSTTTLLNVINRSLSLSLGYKVNFHSLTYLLSSRSLPLSYMFNKLSHGKNRRHCNNSLESTYNELSVCGKRQSSYCLLNVLGVIVIGFVAMDMV